MKYVRGIVAVRSGKKCEKSQPVDVMNDFLRTLHTVEDVVWQLFFPSLIFEHILGVDFWFSNRMLRYVLYFSHSIYCQIMHLLARCISYPFFHVLFFILFSICCTLIHELFMFLMTFVCD